MKIKILVVFFLIVIFNSLCIDLYSQKSMIYDDVDRDYKIGLELFNKQKYGAAQKKFEEVAAYYGNTNSEIKSNAEYYFAICAIELFNKDAEYLISKFLEEHGESTKTKSANFQMGKYQFRKKKYKKAIESFLRVDIYELNKEELAEYYFKIGYSYFVDQAFEKASKAFTEIKDTETKYTSPAIYFYSHIAYSNRNYETALIGFEKLKDDELFAMVIPYYIVQIYYLQNRYAKVIEYAPGLLDSASNKRAPEIARIIGEAFYRTMKYKEAAPYLEIFKEKTNSYSREDMYQLAYAYYRSNNFEQAAKNFKLTTNNNDSLSQNSYYHLASCYLKLNDKPKASLSFASAAKMEFNSIIKEDAMFNYAKLSYELSYSPFNEAINAFNLYIQTYPKSERLDDAYSYLTKAYMSTRNYKDALVSLENIKNINNNDILMAYQRVAFFRGLELFNNLNFDEAIILFDKSLNNSKYNKTIKAQAIYWKAEAYYRLNRYNDAINSYKDFLVSNGAFELPEYKIAHYNLGYVYFKKKEYREAIVWYRKFGSEMGDVKSKIVGDNYNRVGDCYFISRDYNNAVDYYEKAIQINTSDADYAFYQKAFSLGLLKEQNQKIETINKLITNYPNSAYLDDALFELGRAYVEVGNKDLAISTFQKVINEFPGSGYIPKSLLQQGLIYYNTDDNQNAMAIYKKIVADYSGTYEAKQAMQGLKNVYVDMDDVDNYFTYANGQGNLFSISPNEQDSLTYIAAENIYMSGNCDKSKANFAKYIEKFPNGQFLLNAHYYKADCNYKSSEYQDALTSYNYVLTKPVNMFTEESQIRAARLNYTLKKYTEAAALYAKLETNAETKSNVLEARIGQMRCNYYSNNYQPAINAANMVLMTDKISEEMIREANFILAKSYLAVNDQASALEKFKLLAKETKSKEGAEAKFRTIEIYFNQGNLDLASKEVYDFINKNTSHQYWLAKSFIVLADVFVAQNDNFQAKATLQSVMDNYNVKDDGLLETAEEKMIDIKEKEATNLQLKEALDVEINLNNTNDVNDNILFENTQPSTQPNNQ